MLLHLETAEEVDWRDPMQIQGGRISADKDEDNKNLFKEEDQEVEEEDGYDQAFLLIFGGLSLFYFWDR